MARKKPGIRHPNKGARWTTEMQQELIADHERGIPLVELARAYGRTRKAVVARLQKLGIMGYDPDETGGRY